jgi:CRISPR-associated protein Csd2
MSLTNKIDFAVVFSVRNANPNGDPLNGNRPRLNYEHCGEVSDVCLKRKIRNRLQDLGESIFVQSDDRSNDGYHSLKERAENCENLVNALKAKDSNDEKIITVASENWFDVRAFGQVFAYKSLGSRKDVSIGIRGPVSIHSAVSITPVRLSEIQITKSVNNEPGEKKGSDTMGLKHRVDYGVYVTYGSINTQLASKTGFSDADAERIREVLISLFTNDASSARPDGSMEVKKVIWWRHNSPTGQYSSAKVHRSINITTDGDVSISKPLVGLEPEIYDGV